MADDDDGVYMGYDDDDVQEEPGEDDEDEEYLQMPVKPNYFDFVEDERDAGEGFTINEFPQRPTSPTSLTDDEGDWDEYSREHRGGSKYYMLNVLLKSAAVKVCIFVEYLLTIDHDVFLFFTESSFDDPYDSPLYSNEMIEIIDEVDLSHPLTPGEKGYGSTGYFVNY